MSSNLKEKGFCKIQIGKDTDKIEVVNMSYTDLVLCCFILINKISEGTHLTREEVSLDLMKMSKEIDKRDKQKENNV